MVHCHTVHLPLGALLSPCAMCGTGATLEEDEFGKAMLASGIPRETILKWTKDPQVPPRPQEGAPL